jgi:hypothetical protein
MGGATRVGVCCCKGTIVPGETQLDTLNITTSVKIARIGSEIENLFIMHLAS